MHWHTPPYPVPTHQFRNHPNPQDLETFLSGGFSPKRKACIVSCPRDSHISKILVHFLLTLPECPLCQLTLFWHSGFFTGHNLTPTAGYQEEQSLLPSLSWVCWTEPQEGISEHPGLHCGCENSLGGRCRGQLTLHWTLLDLSPKIFSWQAFHRGDVSIDCFYLLNCSGSPSSDNWWTLPLCPSHSSPSTNLRVLFCHPKHEALFHPCETVNVIPSRKMQAQTSPNPRWAKQNQWKRQLLSWSHPALDLLRLLLHCLNL